MQRVIVMALAAVATGAALAQTDVPRNPSDPAVPVPKVEYRSAFADYRPYAEEDAGPAASWRALNDEMGRLGGHRGHLAGAGEGRPDKAQGPAVKPSAHEGHGGHR